MTDSVILIRGRDAKECQQVADSLVHAGKRNVTGAKRVAYTVGAGPFVMIVECLETP